MRFLLLKTGIVIAALAMLPGLAWAIAAPTGLKAAVQSGVDTNIVLRWDPVTGASGYFLFRLNPNPIQTNGIVSSGSDTAGVAWQNPERSADGRYDTGTATAGGPNYGTNDYVQIDFPSPHWIGAIGFLNSRQPDAPNWVRYTAALTVNGVDLSTSLDILNAGNSPGTGRNKYYTLYNPNRTTGGSLLGPPLYATSVRVTESGGNTDGRSAMTEIDLWEFIPLATNVGINATNFVDIGRTAGDSCTYFVVAYDGSSTSRLSNVAAVKAGDRDDLNSGDLAADYQNGAFGGLPAKGVCPAAPSNLAIAQDTLQWSASATESGSGDIRKYVIYRTPAGVSTNSADIVETNATLVSKRVMSTQARVLDGSTNWGANAAGSRAYNNYSESDDIVQFNGGSSYALVRMAIHQAHDGSHAQQHHYRAAYIEAAGGFIAGYNTLTTGGIDFYNTNATAYCSTPFSSTDDKGYATFGFGPKVGGQLPATWLVGDHVTIHLTTGENNVGHAEYQIYGVPVSKIGEVSAGTYSFEDTTAQNFTNYTYFVMAEDYAGNQSEALAGTLSINIPPRGAMILLR